MGSLSSQEFGFKSNDDLKAWECSGEVSIDSSKEQGSLKIGPGGSAVLTLRSDDVSGKVSFKVYDDMGKPEDIKQRLVGPIYGVGNAMDTLLMTGAIYAPYLAGDQTYAISKFQKKVGVFSGVKYLGEKRNLGWHTWTYTFDSKEGLSIEMDGKAVPRKRIDSQLYLEKGFSRIVLIGDQSEAKSTLWVRDVSVSFGGAMEIKAVDSTEVASVTEKRVPDQDPEVKGTVPPFLPPLQEHPRVLFGQEGIAKMKDLYNSPEGEPFKNSLLGYLSACNAPNKTDYLKDATDGQRQGYWRMPTLAMHYLLTGDQSSLQRAVEYMKVLLALPHWEETSELDSGMSVANLMVGAGLCLDWLWNDLEPDFREAFRKKCLYHARAMYYGGHLMKNPGIHYWQGDPANNHRWHRNAGMGLCLLAAYTGAPEEQWIMQQFKNEMDYVTHWLPDDGTTHESPGYMIFGISHLMLGVQAMDHCLGTSYLQLPFFKNIARFSLQSLTPNLKNRFNYGDMGGIGVGQIGYDASLLKAISVHRQKSEQAMMDELIQRNGVQWGWMGLLWYDRSLHGGDYKTMESSAFFEDINVLFARDGWEENGVGVMFKNGPYGGYNLNEYRNNNDFQYINVAHDDPDSNSFILYSNGAYLAETDRYSECKQTSNFNTILINGMGQRVAGRPDKVQWWQPPSADPKDMSKLSTVTALKITPEVDVIEGEASLNYAKLKDPKMHASRPDLDRYRRALIFAKQDYVLVLDDIRAPEAVEISWLLQSPELTVNAKNRSLVMKNGDSYADVSIETNLNQSLSMNVQTSTADTKHHKIMGWQQLHMKAKTEHWVLASLYDVYHRKLQLNYHLKDDILKIDVTGEGIKDQWTWSLTKDRDSSNTLLGDRQDRKRIEVGEADRPAIPVHHAGE